MATYVVPQVLVFQDAGLAVSAAVPPLNAHISGGHAYLVRYSEADERVNGLLGYYDAGADHGYAYPTKPAGSVIDQDYVKVFIKDALLKYHEDAASGGYGTVSTVAGYRNRIRSSAVNYKTTELNGTEYERHASLLRDVKAGDTVRVRAVVSATEYIKWTYVKDFVQDTVAATKTSVTADDDNQGDESAATSYEQTGGPVNCIDIDSVDGSSYDGVAQGNVTETYTIIVTEGSTGGDATTARLRVISASGNDDVDEVTPAAFGSPTAIGDNGLTVTWDEGSGACEDSADNEGVEAGEFIVGQKWEVEVTQDFTGAAPTASGTYTGTKNTTYVVEVTRGGVVGGATPAQITVTTTNGVDISGPSDVASDGTADVGTKGISFDFGATNQQLVKGDKFYISTTAAGKGAAKTLVLGHNLHEDIPSATDVTLELYIRKDIEVNENRLEAPPEVNYEVSATAITLKSGITAYDDSWVDEAGEAQPLEVFSAESKEYGKAYVQYRAWLPTKADAIYSVSDVGDLDDALSGPLHPDNELKWGVFKALSNLNGLTAAEVTFTAVADPSDVDSWLEVLELLVGSRQAYGLVPLTRNQTVLDAYVAHVNDQSTAENGRWKVVWVNLESPSSEAVLDATLSTDEEAVLATITEDTENDEDGAQYTLLTITSENADLDDLEVRAGDIVRAQYTTDGFDNYTYTEYVIDSIVNAETLLLASGPDSAINVAAKIEIHRNLSATVRAQKLGAKAGAYGSKRVRAVWPDEVSSGGVTMKGYHLCAALAGLVSGVQPHQGLTNLEIVGFDDVSRTTGLFNSANLNTMAGNGVWIVTQDPQAGDVYTRHAVTTADYDDVNAREEMVVRNLDSISYVFMDKFAPYIGISNVTPSMLDIIEAETLATIQYLRNANFTQKLGGQLIDATIVELRRSAAFKDRIILRLSLEIPYALNNLEVYLSI